MQFTDIDKNFKVDNTFGETGVDIYDIPHSNFAVYGVYYDYQYSRFVRMDKEVANQVSEGVKRLADNTAGGRMRFGTNSTKLRLRATYSYRWHRPHMTDLSQCGFILLEEYEDKPPRLVKILPPSHTDDESFSVTVDLPSGHHDYILHFPLYNEVATLTIGLDSGAEVTRGKAYRDISPILYYGSSITQGACASRPDNTYQSHISRWNDIDHINLGFSGSALGEEIMARYLATIDTSLFVCDYDANAPTAEHLQETLSRLYHIYREARPDTPILFLSCTMYDNPTYDRGREQVVYGIYKQALDLGDKMVYYISGRTLFGEEDRDNCTTDGTHPNDLGFYRMAKIIYDKMIEIDSKFE